MSNLILIGLVSLILIVSILWNLLRGLSKSRLRGILILVSAILAVVGTLFLRSFLVSDVTIDTYIVPLLENVLNAPEVVEVLQLSGTLTQVLINVVVSLISPILCLLLFWAFSILTWIIFVIVALVRRRAMRARNEQSACRHWRAVAWGAVQGLVIVIMIMIPLTAYLGLVPPVITTLDESDALGENEETVMEIVEEYVQPLQENVFVKAYRGAGGSALNGLMLDFKLDDTKVEITDEIDSIALFAGNILKLTKSDIANYGSAEAAVFISIADSFEDSVLLPTIAGEFIYGATDAWLQDLDFLGAEKPTFGEQGAIFEPFFNTLLNVLHQDSRNYLALQKDFRTVAEMVSVLSEYGVFANLSNTEQLMETLSSNGIIESIVTTLGSNDSMKVLIPEITQMGMRAIATTLEIPENAEAVYGEFMNDVTSGLNEIRALPEDERVDALSERLTTAFDDAGIPIDREIIDCYAISMTEDLLASDAETLTTEDVQAFFAVYAMNAVDETLAEKSNTITLAAGGTRPLNTSDLFAGTVYEGKTEEELKKSGAATLAKATQQLVKLTATEDIAVQASEILTSAYSELLAEKPVMMEKIAAVQVSKPVSDTAKTATAGLKSSEEIVTVRVTLNDLLVDSTEAASKINAETVKAEAEAIASIFNAASELTKTDTSNMDLTAVANTVGNILDSLGATASVGAEKTANLFTAVLQSETVRSTADLDMTTATQMAEKATTGENVSYSQTMGVVSQGVTVFTKLSDPNATLTEEELVELIRTINPQTAGMIEVYVTADRIIGYGVPEQYASSSAQLISETFSYMANSEMSDEEYANEAKALNQILNVAISAKSHSNEKELFGGILPSATETVDIFMASNAIASSLRSCMLDSNGNVKEGKFDLFGIGSMIPEDSNEYKECVDAFQRYYDNHHSEQTRQTLVAISALLGVPVPFN